MYIMSKTKCKCLDLEAIDKYSIPAIILMENAANSIYNEIKGMFKSFIIICGSGNNAGDGLALGRKLFMDGCKVKFVMIKPKEHCSEEFSTNYSIIKKITDNILIINNVDDLKELSKQILLYDVIIDSIFGTGLNRNIDSFYIDLINIINNSGKKIISIDVPSGLDCDTGKPLGGCIKADYTYTFEVIKKGFINYSAFEYLGKLKVVSIGIPKETIIANDEGIYFLNDEEYNGKLKSRIVYGHKGDFGKAVIFAGSIGYLGAAKIVTEACLAAGAGLTTLVTSKEGQEILGSNIIEAMINNFDNKESINKLLLKADALAFGPGIEESRDSEELLLNLLDNSKSNIVIDAEGINILARRSDILNKIKYKVILTPHPGEMARLIKLPIEYINENRVEVAKKVAQENKCVVILKGFNTVVTDGEKVFINPTGNSKMSSGGMGDALTGIITALLAQGYGLLDSAILATYIHGKAAEIAGNNRYSIKAMELIQEVSKVMNLIT